MRIDGGAQVVHHTLADLVGDPRLRHADDAVDDRQGDHSGDHPRQQFQVVVDDPFVDRFAQQERGGDAEDRAEDDQGEQGPETYFVWNEQAPILRSETGRSGLSSGRTGCFSERRPSPRPWPWANG